jgi:hypothetical protein
MAQVRPPFILKTMDAQAVLASSHLHWKDVLKLDVKRDHRN